MNVNDLHGHSKVLAAFATTTIATDTTTAGIIIDTEGFEALEFLILSGTITLGDAAISLQHGDAANLSDATTVDAEEILGSGVFAVDADDEVRKMGYIGKKRFVRLSIVTDNSANLTLTSLALLAFAPHQPTAEQV